MDTMVYVAIIVAIIFRLVIMRGSFVLPACYRRDNEMSYNLGSISTIIIAILADFGLMYASPELSTSPHVAFVTAYTVPQIVDGAITSGARNFIEVAEEKVTDYEEAA